MELYVCGSSSKGNCYIIKSKSGTLILDAGVDFKEIQKVMKFDFSNLLGILITHEHLDHSKYITNFARKGINIYSSLGTFNALELIGHRYKRVNALEQFELGNFLILPFDVQHDAIEPLGFIIYDKISKEKLLYATDTYYIKYKFSNVNYLLLECNYITDIVKENRLKGKIHKSMYQRLLKSHFSLEHVLEFLKANDLSSVREIILCHLSDKNSNENVMIREVYNLTGIKTVVASSKMQLEFKLYPF